MFNNLIRKQYDANSDMWSGVGAGALSGATAGLALGPWGAAVGGLVGGGISLVSGLSQKKKAHDLLNQNKYPIYQIPKAIKDNLTNAQAQANTGLPSQTYNNAAKDIQRNQVATLLSAQRTRKGLPAIVDAQGKTNDAFGKLNAADASARVANEKQLYGINAQYGNYENSAFNWNQKNKYEENRQYGMQLLGAGNQNFTGGLDKIGGALALFAGSGGFRGRKKYNQGDIVDSTHTPSWYGSDQLPASPYAESDYSGTLNPNLQ